MAQLIRGKTENYAFVTNITGLHLFVHVTDKGVTAAHKRYREGYYLSEKRFVKYGFHTIISGSRLFLHVIPLFRINLRLFSTVVPSNICMFLSCRPFVVITTLSTGLVGVEVTSVSWLGQLTVGV